MKKIIVLLTCLLFFSCLPTKISNNNKPIVVFTFDDDHISIYNFAFKNMQKYGYTGTNFVFSSAIGKANMITWENLRTMQSYGWETAGHTVNHVNLPDCDDKTALFEIKQNYLDIKNNTNVSPVSFALPSGHASPKHFEIINSFYKNIRTSINLRHKNPINNKFLGYFFYDTAYTYKDVITRLDVAEKNNEPLLIIGFHRFLQNPQTHPDNCKPKDFLQIIKTLSNRGYKVYSLQKALDILL